VRNIIEQMVDVGSVPHHLIGQWKEILEARKKVANLLPAQGKK